MCACQAPFAEVRVSQQTKAYPAVRYYAAGLTDSQQLQTVAALGATYTAAPLPCVTSTAYRHATLFVFAQLHKHMFSARFDEL